MSFADKVVIVTGASSGIGAAIAVKFSEEKAGVVIVGRNEKKLKNVFQKCQKSGGKCHIVVADVTKEGDAKRIVEETIKCFKKIDILVNNAGIGGNVSILDENLMDLYEKIAAVNIRAVVQMTNLCAKYLVQTKGNIINISSVMSTTVSDFSIYSMSKAAVDHFTRCVAIELASKGVRVNAINPGPVNTDIIENTGLSGGDADVMWDKLRKMTALDRVADAEEIGDLALFVASHKGRSITGSCVLSDNGTFLKGFQG